jgi:hypothetical protein
MIHRRSLGEFLNFVYDSKSWLFLWFVSASETGNFAANEKGSAQ